jgi:predicted nucleic acid-binding protein
VFVEPESAQVAALLLERNTSGELLASSELAWVEISRALLRAGVVDVESELAKACAGIAQQRLDARIVTRARTIGPPTLRSLDAIHLAAALSLGATEMLTFDHRLAEAATAAGVKAIP